jgi:hypothetical protein
MKVKDVMTSSAKPPHDADGKDQPENEQHRLQEVLPKVKAVAQKVGGFKQLADIAESFDQHDQLQATGMDQPMKGQHRLRELLPEVTDLAQKVGGFKQLAELAMTLDQSKE